MRRTTLALAGLVLLSSGLRAEAPARFEPVPGGFSSRLEPLRSSLDAGKADFQAELTKTLDSSRKQAHDLIDEIVDSDGLTDWLKSMEKNDQDGFAAQLIGKDKEIVRKALHSRLDRRLAAIGAEITKNLQEQEEGKLKASFDLAVNHLAKEEGHLMEAAANSGVETLGDSGNEDAPSEAPSAPRASLVVQNYYGYGQGGRRAYNAARQSGYSSVSAYNRTLQAASQRAWFSNQLRATAWNNKVNSFNRYLYGSSMPSYANPRYRRVGLPAGYYYRPDRVERVVRRGLWGAAAVAATPFALVASMF